MDYDTIIIGGGPAGLTAGIYAGRARRKTLLLERNITGGLAAITEIIENYPGFPDGIAGMDLLSGMRKQAERFGTEIREFEEVLGIRPLDKKIEVTTAERTYSTCSVIVASGGTPRKLNLPGEAKFHGKGVSYCATCDGPLYRDKDIVVVGGGDTAVVEALSLAKFVRRIILVHRRYELRSAKILEERLKKTEKVEFLLNHILTSITGDGKLRSVTVQNLQSGEEKNLKVSGLFIYVGFLPNSKFLEGIVELDDTGYIITNEKMETSVEGVYAAGDVRSKKVRQVSTAVGEGTIASISAERRAEKRGFS